MTDPPRWPAAPTQPPPAPRAGGPVAGATDVLRGIGLFLRTPGVRLLGILPVVLAALLVLVLLGLLVVYLDELADALTPFADRWEEGSRTLVRVGAGLALLLTSTAVLVVSFTVIAQIIGQPFTSGSRTGSSTSWAPHRPAPTPPGGGASRGPRWSRPCCWP